MGLAAAFAGEAAIDAVADRIEPEANIDDAEEAILLAIFATLIEAVDAAQRSGNARNRLGERLLDANGDANAPICSQLLMQIASVAGLCRNELLNTVAGLTEAELLATVDSDASDHVWANNGPVH